VSESEVFVTHGQIPSSEGSILPRPVVYLHIGAPKSGTTFLQTVLWRNKEVLAEQGVLLPGDSFGAQVRAMRDLRGLVPEPTEAADWEGAWDELVSEALETSARVAVISSETLAAADGGQARRAIESFGDCEVHIVYSARDLAGLLPSEWQEYVKHRFHHGFETWLAEVVDGGPGQGAGDWFWRVHEIGEVLERWSVTLPPDRVHLVTMPGPGAPRNLLWKRFASVLGIDPDSVDLNEAGNNSSLGPAEVEFLRRINRTIGDEVPMWLYHQVVTDLFALQMLPGCGTDEKVALPAARHAGARERAHQLVEAVRQAGFDIVGDLEELLPGSLDGQDVSRHPDGVSEAEQLDVAAEAVLRLLDHITSLREEISQLHGDIGRLHSEIDDARSKPLYKAVVRHMSGRNRAVWRMRVGYWHMIERVRGIEPQEPEKDEEPPEPVEVPSLSAMAPTNKQ
jgi:hypothetical protein